MQEERTSSRSPALSRFTRPSCITSDLPTGKRTFYKLRDSGVCFRGRAGDEPGGCVEREPFHCSWSSAPSLGPRLTSCPMFEARLSQSLGGSQHGLHDVKSSLGPPWGPGAPWRAPSLEYHRSHWRYLRCLNCTAAMFCCQASLLLGSNAQCIRAIRWGLPSIQTFDSEVCQHAMIMTIGGGGGEEISLLHLFRHAPVRKFAKGTTCHHTWRVMVCCRSPDFPAVACPNKPQCNTSVQPANSYEDRLEILHDVWACFIMANTRAQSDFWSSCQMKHLMAS